MCGFLLIFDPRGIREDDALRALQTLESRGPDDVAHAFFDVPASAGGNAPTLFIGHRRLAIIGLGPENRQPFRHGRTHLAFNGEIYNYIELAAAEAELGGASSDTAVLAAGLALHGREFLPRLNGMYAGVAYDEERERLLFFRDPSGQKPLYLYRRDGLLIAASEPKAIQAYRALEVDEAKLLRGFLVGYHGGSPHRDVDVLAPGHRLELELPSGDLVQAPVPHAPGDADDEPTLDRAGFGRCFSAALERHLRSDVPVGLYLSGGIDSTLTLHYLKQIGVTPHCFTIGFREPGFDESGWAKQAAEHYGAPIEVQYVEAPSFDEACAILDYFDEPFYDSSAIPTALLNRMAAAHVKVVLGGDGGDELFCGYRRYIYTHYLERLKRTLGRTLGGWAVGAARTLGTRRIRNSKYLSNAPLEHAEALFRNSHDLTLLEHVNDPAAAETSVRDALAAYVQDFTAPGPNGYFLGDVPNYLSCDILMKSDRCSMMHSVEQRAPLLDAEVVRFGLRLPARQKLAGVQGKRMLKQIVADELGSAFAYRRKSGFCFPLREFLVTNEAAVKETIAGGLNGDAPVSGARVLAESFAEAAPARLDHIWKLFTLGRFLGQA